MVYKESRAKGREGGGTFKNVLVRRITNNNNFFDFKHVRESVETAKDWHMWELVI